MSSTVEEAFNTFNKNHVNLDPDRTKVARASRDWLLGQLATLPGKGIDFHTLYDGQHLNFGSFSRNTKIRELDDIDLILCFHGQSSTYETIIRGSEYAIRPNPAYPSSLKEICNEDGTYNSIKLVNKIVGSLDKIEQYKTSEKHRKQEAATLSLNSYEWVFDIVPAFYTADTAHYLIPDGVGGWKATDPRIDQERVNRINLKHNGKILQIIRTLKFWNRRAAVITISPYLFENIILNYFDSLDSTTDYIDISLKWFWSYLKEGIHYTVDDPKGFQGELNTLTWQERNAISNKAREAYTKATEAIELETKQGNHAGAIRKWSEIFGENFI